MADSNDHDLLIELNTKVNILIQQQSEFVRASTNNITALIERITALESKDSRDSEKVRAIDINVQRSLDNHTRIGILENEMKSLRSKAGLWDIGNSIVAAIALVWTYLK